jgi:hypothetical protein
MGRYDVIHHDESVDGSEERVSRVLIFILIQKLSCLLQGGGIRG